MRDARVTTRRNPILHTLVGPGEGHTSLAGIPTKGVTTKTIDDATYPWRMRDAFERAQFLDVAPAPWVDGATPYTGSGE